MFINILAFLLTLFFFTTVLLGVILWRTKNELHSAKKLAGNRHQKIRAYQDKYNAAVLKHNHLADKWNELPTACRQGKCGTLQNQQLTLDDLKRLRFYLHPDKHQGKTTDLANKINYIFEERNNDTSY